MGKAFSRERLDFNGVGIGSFGIYHWHGTGEFNPFGTLMFTRYEEDRICVIPLKFSFVSEGSFIIDNDKITLLMIMEQVFLNIYLTHLVMNINSVPGISL